MEVVLNVKKKPNAGHVQLDSFVRTLVSQEDSKIMQCRFCSWKTLPLPRGAKSDVPPRASRVSAMSGVSNCLRLEELSTTFQRVQRVQADGRIGVGVRFSAGAS